jgi:predicted enzyme related to lactoylglutathione lyase
MPNPVVHFEVIGKDGPALQRFYGDLFGWSIDADNPMNYGMVDNGGEGINGGIGPAPEGGSGHVTFYVQVDDIKASLDKAKELGGTPVFGPTEVPGGGPTIALFNDPEGHLIGLVKGM